VFEVWADAARLYHLDPAYSDVTGYSMGGMGTLKLGSQFSDLFARAQSTVGFEPNTGVLASMRDLPVREPAVLADLSEPSRAGNQRRVRARGRIRRLRDGRLQPRARHVRRRRQPQLPAVWDERRPRVLGLRADAQKPGSHRANGDPIGQFDAVSHGFGAGDPAASGVQGVTPGTLSGGNMGAWTAMLRSTSRPTVRSR
jgi:hypothetical protein